MSWSGERIKEMRKRMGWSSFDLARRLGCTHTELLSWEEGVEAPSSEICDHLNRFEYLREVRANELAEDVMAESVMRQQGLEQMSRSDLDEHK